MKNFKQVIAPLVLAICVAGTAMLVSAAWSDPTCTAGDTSCNPSVIVNRGDDNQVKTSQFGSIGYTLNSTNYKGYLISRTNVESGGSVNVGTSANTGDFRVVSGYSWFKGFLDIGEPTLTATNYPDIRYNLQLTGNTNIGMGDYCTIRAAQTLNPASRVCPNSGEFGPSLMTYYRQDATGTDVQIRCGKLNPTTNSTAQNLGYCYKTDGPNNVTITDHTTPVNGPGSSLYCTKKHEPSVAWTGGIGTIKIEWTVVSSFNTSTTSSLGTYYISDPLNVQGYKNNINSVPKYTVTARITDSQNLTAYATIVYAPEYNADCPN